jgi:hypothetical protein
MDSHNSDGSRAATARAGFLALCAALAMGLGSLASPAVAAPFAYVANAGDNTVSVIDTATSPRPWWPRSRWGASQLGSPSPRTGNTSKSQILAPTTFR